MSMTVFNDNLFTNGYLPITDALDVFVREKARLRRAGTPLDDFDLLLGATAVVHQLTLLTTTTRHLARVEQVLLEDWTQP